ncbi:uncharacterized protein LOC135845076 [Planococcus citri]|uniref:uncharacterized protein LOC135845076 n=1 Tax=Planococcus citri TaxID=170843 RepID=UPI0031F8F5F6
MFGYILTSSSSESKSKYRDLEHGDCKPISAPRLEKIASVSAAIALWNHATVMMPSLIVSDPTDCLKGEILKCIDVLSVPKSSSELIERNFHALQSNVDRWVSYVADDVFFWGDERSDLYQYVNCIIWHSNGSINSAETARNILKYDKFLKFLSDEEKFRLACTYCLREEIEKIWPMVKDFNVVFEFQFSQFPLVYYWRYYFSDNLDKIRTPENQSIDEFMIRQRRVDNWPAIEYFFDGLDAEKQVTQVIWSINKRESSVQKFLLAKLSESLRLRVIMDRFVQIMDNYTSSSNIDDDDLAISIWHDARDLITEKQFFELYSLLLKNRTEDFVLAEIWNTAREDFKRQILNYGDDDFIKRILERCVSVYRPMQSSTFLSAVLTDHVSADVRREITKKAFFNEWCEKLIRENAVEALGQLINSLNFGEHCKSLLVAHNIQALALEDVIDRSRSFGRRNA